MKRQFSAQRLDVQAFAEDGARLEGTTGLREFERLAAEAVGGPGERNVQWAAEGELVDPRHLQPQVWVHLQASCTLAMTCQRCLEPVEVALEVDRSFRFVADEPTAAAQDDDAEEDVLALSRSFDLLALVEDELIMELPVVPRHEVCPTPVRLSAQDADFEDAVPDHPFARLKVLKGGQG